MYTDPAQWGGGEEADAVAGSPATVSMRRPVASGLLRKSAPRRTGDSGRRHAAKESSEAAAGGVECGSGSAERRPPTYPRQPHAISAHGDTRVDPYFWLREGRRPRGAGSPRTKTGVDPRWQKQQQKIKRLLQEENAYTESLFSKYASGLRKQLFSELKQRLKEDDISLPSRDRSYWYYMRAVKSAPYPIYCRRPVVSQAESTSGDMQTDDAFVREVAAFVASHPQDALPPYPDGEIILDVNILVMELGLEYIEVGDMDVSHDEKKLLLTVDCSGGKEVFTLLVLEIRDVNYARWLAAQPAAHQSWCHGQAERGSSVYALPTPTSLLSSPIGSTVEGSPLSGSPYSPTRRKNTFPSHPSTPLTVEELSAVERHAAAGTLKGEAPTAGGMGQPELPATPSVGNTVSGTFPDRKPPRKSPPYPKHRVLHRIEMFDASSEAMWVNEDAFVFIGIDEKRRPFRVIYHNTSVPADTDESDIICYEELDDAFWVDSISFSADKRFFMFHTSSGNSSEWYVAPAEPVAPLEKGRLSGPPQQKKKPRGQVTESSQNTTSESSEEDGPSDETQPGPALTCFEPRRPSVEYDLDHHESLLCSPSHACVNGRPGGGAWIVVTNTNRRDNFAVDFIEDSCWETFQLQRTNGAGEGAGVGEALGAALWKPLFDYDPLIKVDGVECWKDMLTISVRKDAFPTVLFCPIHRIHEWYSERGSSRDVSCLHICADTVNALLLIPAADRSCAAAAPAPSLPLVVAEQLWLAPLMQHHRRRRSTADNGPTPSLAEPPALLGTHTSPKDVALITDEVWQMDVAQVDCVDAYATGDAFSTSSWHITVSNMICPSLVYSVTFTPLASPMEADTLTTTAAERAHGSVRVVLLRRELVNGPAYTPRDYFVKVLWVPARDDGTDDGASSELSKAQQVHIPVYVCGKVSCFQPGANPLLLTVYGSYGESSDPEFTAERLSLLERGFVYAIAGVRGGGDLGRPWRDAGRLQRRGTSVRDVVCVAQFLRDVRWSTADRLLLSGSSAGGFVATAAVNARPDLFCALLASVPFVDCLTTLLDPELPLTISDWEEYGNPIESAEAYYAIKAYSPVDNIPSYPYQTTAATTQAGEPARAGSSGGSRKAVLFPHMFFQTSWGDSRVGYWESLSMVAHLREVWPAASEGAGRFLAHFCDFNSGHGGASGRYESLREIAREYAFAVLAAQQGARGSRPGAEVARP